MATKAAMASGDNQPFKKPKFVENIFGAFSDLTRFLSDVRAEMRKVVAPTWKEVRVTTSVVIVATFLFGLFFFIVDSVFQAALMGPHGLLSRLGGGQ
jgi:preprotein translocase subunit SecE